MKLRNTLILVVLCVGLFAYIKFYDSKQLTTDEQRENKGRVLNVNRDKVDAVTIRNSEGVIEFKKRADGTWMIESPVKDRAESLAMSTLFTSLEGLRMDAVPAGKAGADSMQEYGLAKGDLSIKATGESPFELLIGKETAVEGKVYMRVEGKPLAYVAGKDLRDQASKGLKDWRDRKLSDVAATQVNKIVIKVAKGELEAEKKGEHWSMVRPFKARADDQKLGDLVSNATTPRIEDFLPATKDLAAYGLTEPRATITMHADGVKEPLVLQIGAAKQDEKKDEKKPAGPDDPPPPPPTHVYVQLSSREGVFTVPAAIESLISIQPNDLRDQNIMRVQTDMVDRITIEAAGKEKIVLGRKGEDWVRKGDNPDDTLVNGGAANKLLSDLTTAKVTRFVTDVASDPKQFGLDQPQLSVTLSSYSTEGTPESKPGERPLAKLLLGKFEGDAGYAKLEDEPFVVAVPSHLLDSLWTDPLQWQDLKVLDLKREELTGLEITRIGQPTLSFELDKNKEWKLSKGDGTVNQFAAQSLVNTLASLRAARWLGATNPAEHGIEKPNLVIGYTMADKKTGRVAIGSNTPDEMWHATSAGKTGTFLIVRPDFDALNGALIETPKPATPVTPAPAAGATVTPAPVPAPPSPPAPPTGNAPVNPAPDASPAPPTPASPNPTEAPAGQAKPAPDAAPKP
jgi:hypothetical protein